MTDLIFAAAFIAMVASPAMVATFGGRKEYNPDPDSDPEPEDAYRVRPAQRAGTRIIHPHSLRSLSDRIVSDDSTLPMLNGRGMSNR